MFIPSMLRYRYYSASASRCAALREFDVVQLQPEYDDSQALEESLYKAASLPLLVHPKEIDTLKRSLAACAAGRNFLIQVFSLN